MANQAPQIEELVAISEALMPVVYEAGDFIMGVHEEHIHARQKPDGSPVTLADEGAEALILPALGRLTPDITVISEENAASHKVTAPDLFWLVDPLDGTKEFLKPEGSGHFTVNIGLIYKGTPIMGLIYAPVFDDLYVGIVGHGAQKISQTHRGPIAVRDVPDTGAVAVASSSHRDEATNDWLWRHQIEQTISVGSSLKLCLLAEGKADVYPRFGPVMEWDTAAGDAILRAAGGLMMTPDLTPYPYGKADYLNTPFIASGLWHLQPE